MINGTRVFWPAPGAWVWSLDVDWTGWLIAIAPKYRNTPLIRADTYHIIQMSKTWRGKLNFFSTPIYVGILKPMCTSSVRLTWSIGLLLRLLKKFIYKVSILTFNKHKIYFFSSKNRQLSILLYNPYFKLVVKISTYFIKGSKGCIFNTPFPFLCTPAGIQVYFENCATNNYVVFIQYYTKVFL